METPSNGLPAGVFWHILGLIAAYVIAYGFLAMLTGAGVSLGGVEKMFLLQPGVVQLLSTPFVAWRLWQRGHTRSMQAALIVGGLILLVNGLCVGLIFFDGLLT